MKDEFLKKLKTAKILRVALIVLAIVWVISYMTIFSAGENFVSVCTIVFLLLLIIGIVYLVSYKPVIKCNKWLCNIESENVFDDVPSVPTLPKSKAYCGSKCIVFKKPFVAIPYYEIAWTYIQVNKTYGITMSKQVHIYCLSGAHFMISADVSEFDWLLENYLLRLNPNIILGYGYKQKREYRELKKNYKNQIVTSTQQNNMSAKSSNTDINLLLKEKYQLRSVIGEGATSKVYFAIDIQSNKPLAIKILKDDYKNDRQAKWAFINEAQTLMRLNHPAVPKVADIINNSECAAVVMDYAEGKTLEEVIEKHGAQSAELVIDISLQLCGFLEYLHSFNPPYIYRDMKPANIILKPDMEIAVVDFGIMRTYKSGKAADTVCLGTSGFAPPEQYGTAQTDPRSDIYSLGMTMYCICFGVNPQGKNYQITDDAITSLDAEFLAIIKKCTELNPNDRYSSCAELRNDLNSLKEKYGLFN